ncbi:hypothetical protein [Accumulibacter sp.]|nr:hypothetical protein [Accumulibacter sp.]
MANQYSAYQGEALLQFGDDCWRSLGGLLSGRETHLRLSQANSLPQGLQPFSNPGERNQTESNLVICHEATQMSQQIDKNIMDEILKTIAIIPIMQGNSGRRWNDSEFLLVPSVARSRPADGGNYWDGVPAALAPYCPGEGQIAYLTHIHDSSPGNNYDADTIYLLNREALEALIIKAEERGRACAHFRVDRVMCISGISDQGIEDEPPWHERKEIGLEVIKNGNEYQLKLSGVEQKLI